MSDFTPNWKRNKQCGLCGEPYTSAKQAGRHAAAHVVKDAKASVILNDKLVSP